MEINKVATTVVQKTKDHFKRNANSYLVGSALLTASVIVMRAFDKKQPVTNVKLSITVNGAELDNFTKYVNDVVKSKAKNVEISKF